MIYHGTGTRGLVAALLPDEKVARTSEARYRQLSLGLDEIEESAAWLLFAVIVRALPRTEDVVAALRLQRLSGTPALIRHLRRERRLPGAWFRHAIRVVTPTLLIDVHETATLNVRTGVQRVVRAIAERWTHRADVEFVCWSADHRQLRHLRRRRPSRGSVGGLRVTSSWRGIAPAGGVYFVPEVFTNPVRTRLTASLVKHSRARGVMFGYDCIPLTLAETTGPGMPGAFAGYLSAAAHMDLILCDSEAAAQEYSGWRSMLSSANLRGPRVIAHPLAVETGLPDLADEAAARAVLLTVDDRGETLPMILCVGSHEPRKNHAAVLHAAESLWRDGVQFSLVFIGGASWARGEFDTQLARLRRDNRPVRLLKSAPDSTLWWAYRLARLSVFPSYGEGFGLPVAESLLSGTPAVTSNFGSMAEIARGGGCLLVDPRSDTELATAMRSLLTDEAQYERLRLEAAERRFPSWDDYADQLWNSTMA